MRKKKTTQKNKTQKTNNFLQNWKCINKLKSASQKKKRIKAHFLCKTIPFFFYNGIYFWYKWNRCNTLNNTAPLNIDWILILKTETQEILGLTLGIKCDIEFCLCVFVCSCRTEVDFVIFTWYSGILLDCSPGSTKLEFSLPRNQLRIQVLYDPPPIYKYIYIICFTSYSFTMRVNIKWSKMITI